MIMLHRNIFRIIYILKN